MTARSYFEGVRLHITKGVDMSDTRVVAEGEAMNVRPGHGFAVLSRSGWEWFFTHRPVRIYGPALVRDPVPMDPRALFTAPRKSGHMPGIIVAGCAATALWAGIVLGGSSAQIPVLAIAGVLAFGVLARPGSRGMKAHLDGMVRTYRFVAPDLIRGRSDAAG